MMPTMMLRVRRSTYREEGFTLVELMIASSLMMTVLVVFTSALIAIQRAAISEDRRSQNNDQARIAVEALDREIRSANYIYNPESESVAGQMLRIYTQTNAPTRSPAPGYLCVLWQITSDNRLQTRNWPPLQPGLATPWRTVSTGIVNRSLSIKAFSMDTDPSKGFSGDATTGTGRTVNMVLMANQYLTELPSATVRVELAMTGRNVSYGFPANTCSSTPA
jgi:type II secretory pathway component PulJ